MRALVCWLKTRYILNTVVFLSYCRNTQIYYHTIFEKLFLDYDEYFEEV